MLYQQVDTAGNGGFHLSHVCTHPRHYVAPSLCREESEGQFEHFSVNLHAYVLHHSCAQRQHYCRGSKIAECLQTCHHYQSYTHHAKGEKSPVGGYQFLNIGIAVVLQYLFVDGAPRHFLIGVNLLVYLKENVQYRYQHNERKHVEPLRKEIEHHRPHKVFPVGHEVAFHYLEKLLKHSAYFLTFNV